MTTKAIIFDVGGVIAEDMHSPMLRKLALERYSEKVNTVLDAAKRPWRRIAVCTNYTEYCFWDDIIKASGLGENVEELKAMLRREWMIPFWEPLGLAVRLKRRGYLVGILSNHCKEWYTELFARFRLHDIFPADLCVASFQIGCAKPDLPCLRPYSAIYDKAHCIAGVQRSDCVFVDDKQANVDAAITFGMKGTVFDARNNDVVELVDYLAAQGIKAGEHILTKASSGRHHCVTADDCR